jgi:hypothetical protein
MLSANQLTRATRGRLARIALLAIVGGGLSLVEAGSASANWAYTTWGMTPDQVVAASNGAVRLIPAAKRKQDDADNWEIAAEGDYQDGDFALSASFMFDLKKGGLICVLYSAPGKQSELIRPAIEKKYGKPIKEDELFTLKTTTWHTPDEVELSADTTHRSATVMHCQEGR